MGVMLQVSLDMRQLNKIPEALVQQAMAYCSASLAECFGGTHG